MDYIILVEGWGYYAGHSKKYADRFYITCRSIAKTFNEKEEAERIAEALKNGGYEVEIEQKE